MSYESVTIVQKHDDSYKPKVININNKELLLPNFSIKPEKLYDYDVFIDMKKRFNLPYSQSITVRLFDALKVMERKKINMRQTTLFKNLSIEQNYVESLSRDFILIDPSLEYLFYKRGEYYYNCTFLPDIFKNYISILKQNVTNSDYAKILTKEYTKLIELLRTNEREKIQLIRDILRLEVNYNADIFIPPIPLIRNNKTLELAKEINNLSFEISKSIDSNRGCTHYYPLHSSILRNDKIINEIINMIYESPNDVTIFKFKYLNLNNENLFSERENYKRILNDLNTISQLKENKRFILLESGNQLFPSAVKAFDVVSSSFNGDRTPYRYGGGTRTYWGSYYDPQFMIQRNWENIKRYYSNHNVLPCYCPICTQVSDLFDVGSKQWNKLRREHYVFSKSREMEYIYDALNKGELQIGAEDKLNRSQLKYISDLI